MRQFVKKIALYSLLNFVLSLGTTTQAHPHTSPPPTPLPHCYQAAVSTSERLATQAGLDILRQGGNAVDAAVAIGYALAVAEPCCSGLGGGGFMLIRMRDAPANPRFLNFREKAPAKLTSAHFFDDQNQYQKDKAHQGYAAVGVPGTVMGLNTALEKFGTLSRRKVMAPAIKLAKHGFILNGTHAERLQSNQQALAADAGSKALFFRDGRPYREGELWVQTKLANSLQTIAKKGNAGFYQGRIAKAIVKASRRGGGVLTQKDFDNYTVSFEKPITCRYRGHAIITAPPPSGGGIALCQMLTILEQQPLFQAESPLGTRLHLMIEAMRYGFASRNRHLGDPVFVNNPIKKLLSDEHFKTIEQTLQPNQATPSHMLCPQPTRDAVSITRTPAHTTHYSVIDQWGNAVSATLSLNSYFGARVAPPNTGIVLNNHINDFTIVNTKHNQYKLQQGQGNRLTGNKRPLSSMTPTMVYKDKQLKFILGSPGGPTIITTLLHTLVRHIDFGEDLQTAIDAPRFHMQCQPNTVYMEPGVFTPALEQQLRALGHNLQIGSIYHTPEWGAIAAISVHRPLPIQSDTQDGHEATPPAALPAFCYSPYIDKRRPHGWAEGV